MSLAAGAIFGLALGSLLVWLGAVLGEIGCFVVGRQDLFLLPSNPSYLAACWQAMSCLHLLGERTL